VVADIAARLASDVERYEARRDTRAVFAYLYLQLTRTLATSLAVGDPVFRDPGFVANLADSLAHEYFTVSDEMDAWLTAADIGPDVLLSPADITNTIPEPWREVFAAQSGGRSFVLEDALFSMMAHISYDLPTALRRLADQTDVTSHVADFHLMNDVLGESIEFVQDELASRYGWWLADLDHLFAGDDELLSNYGIRVSRGMAWYNLSRLTDQHAAADAERSIRTSTGALIRQAREPSSWLLRIALHMARFVIPERRRWPTPGTRA
jgi:hypothetical protein